MRKAGCIFSFFLLHFVTMFCNNEISNDLDEKQIKVNYIKKKKRKNER